MRLLARKLAYRLMRFGTGGHWSMEIGTVCPQCQIPRTKDADLLDCMRQLAKVYEDQIDIVVHED